MFNLGLPELLVIGAAGLLLFGPKRLPELGKSLGKGIRDFKKALDGEEEPTPPTQIAPPQSTVSTPTQTTAEAEKKSTPQG
jgi:sec-independent protein translocase protein TatA